MARRLFLTTVLVYSPSFPARTLPHWKIWKTKEGKEKLVYRKLAKQNGLILDSTNYIKYQLVDSCELPNIKIKTFLAKDFYNHVL